MPKEPLARDTRHVVQCAGLLEQVGGASHNLEPCFGPHLALGVLIHGDQRCVQSADDEQRRCDNTFQHRPSQVWTSATGHDSLDCPRSLGGRNQRRSTACACAEVTNAEFRRRRVTAPPISRVNQSLCQLPMSKRKCVVTASTWSSSGVSRSMSSVARPTLCSMSTTYRLRGRCWPSGLGSASAPLAYARMALRSLSSISQA